MSEKEEKAKTIVREMPTDISQKMRILKTFLLFIPFVAMGMTYSIQFTTIPDMRIRLRTNAQQISYAFGLGTAGGLLGGPTASVVDRFSRYADLFIAITLFEIGLSFGMFPFSGSVWVLGVLCFFFQFGFSLYQAAAHSVISVMWGPDGGPARFAVHFGFPLGSMLGPLIAMPFVSGPVLLPDNLNENGTDYIRDNYDNGLDNINLTATTIESLYVNERQEDTSSIEYAYLICTAFLTITAAVFLLFQVCCKPPKQDVLGKNLFRRPESFKQVFSPKEWADGDSKFGMMILLMSMAFFILQMATMKGTQEYLVTYAVDSGMFTNKQAALLNSVVFGTGALARGIAIVVSRFVAAPYMLFVETHGQLLFGFLCLIFGTRSRLSLCILAPCLGAFRELIWPTGYAWMDHYIILLGFLVGLTDVTNMIFNMALGPLQGFLYDNTVIESIFYTTVGFGLAECILIYIMTYTASRKGGRKARALEKQEALTEYKGNEDTKC